jgi:hypothetical protein
MITYVPKISNLQTVSKESNILYYNLIDKFY